MNNACAGAAQEKKINTYMDKRGEDNGPKQEHPSEECGNRGYSLSWREAQHDFERPLFTAHGRWTSRRSIIVRLTDANGKKGYGEMAPVQGFAGPDVETCAAICAELGNCLQVKDLRSPSLPDCARFAFGSALAMLEGRLPRRGLWPLSRLLPPGPIALFETGKRTRTGCRCFKYKLNGIPDATEREIIEMLFESLHAARGKLRIDANESLPVEGMDEFTTWLTKAGGNTLDFLEQPFPVGMEAQMREIMALTGVPIALDESVTGMESISEWLDWPGPLVIKPALAGDPLVLLRLLDARKGRNIMSSALESPVGLWGCLLAIGEKTPEPLGFGTGLWPEGDAWAEFTDGASLDSSRIIPDDAEAVWNGLGD